VLRRGNIPQGTAIRAQDSNVLHLWGVLIHAPVCVCVWRVRIRPAQLFMCAFDLASTCTSPLVKYAKDSKGVAGAFAPLVIWLFTFSIESMFHSLLWLVALHVCIGCTLETHLPLLVLRTGVPNLAHATLLMQRNRTWGRLTEVRERSQRSLYTHILLNSRLFQGSISENFGRYLRCILMSLCFLMHINLYGISSYLLGPLVRRFIHAYALH
jgi:hypothetical protein